MTGSRRSAGSRRRKKQSAGPGAAVWLLTAIVAVAGVVAAFVVLRPSDGGGTASVAPAETGAVPTPKTGRPLDLRTIDGFTYRVAAVAGGQKPSGEAYIDYTLTNTGPAEAPLEQPGDLFLPGDRTDAECMPQPGADEGFCTVANSSDVIGFLGGAKPPKKEADGLWMAPGAAYLLRVTTKTKVDKVGQDDLRLYVWDVRFIADRRATPVSFP